MPTQPGYATWSEPATGMDASRLPVRAAFRGTATGQYEPTTDLSVATHRLHYDGATGTTQMVPIAAAGDLPRMSYADATYSIYGV